MPRTQIVFCLARLDCWSVGSHVEFRGNQAEKGASLRVKQVKTDFVVVVKLFLSVVVFKSAAFLTGRTD